MSRRVVAVAASLVLLSQGFATQAFADCTRLAFSVNDYGKEGPTNDAKSLLDKYIKTWTSERGIKSFTVGPKDVSCELFLNFIVFDEHTCKASALVCWSGPRPPDPSNASTPKGATATAVEGAPKAAPKKSAPPKASATDGSAIATGSVKPAATKAVTPKAAAPAAAAPAAAPVAAPIAGDVTPPKQN